MSEITGDEYCMRLALEQAGLAYERDEVPVGAILTGPSGELIASGHNQPVSANDPTAHAEIIVVREAARRLQNYRLPQTTLFVTLEPCAMCVGALVHARVKRIVYGALEPRTGAIRSAHQIFESDQLNHYPQVSGGVLESDCAEIISRFFRQKRQKKKFGQESVGLS